MSASRRPGERSGSNAPALGAFTAGQLVRLCDVVALSASDAEIYARVLVDTLGPLAERPLDLPPPSDSFLSDDHTPVEFSLSFLPGATPTLRLLLEPGCGVGGLPQNGRTGLRVVRELARRWDFSTGQLDRLEDLFFPASTEGPSTGGPFPEDSLTESSFTEGPFTEAPFTEGPSAAGSFALWCALELRPGGVPRMKVYLNPAASGQERSADTVREALRRLGHREAFESLPRADGYPFLALDLGDWDTPRVKVYLRHDDLSAAEACRLPRMSPGPGAAEILEFFGTAAGSLRSGEGQDARLGGRPGLSCHAFTESATGLPSGFTLHIPVRDYVRHDGEALARAVTVLSRHGMNPAPLLGSLAAVTSRLPREGVGLIAYLALTHQHGRPPRVTAYISSEAYSVRPPVARLPQQVETVH
ncbi:tryptophan dimethylallyltransferase family protein [Streptomyces sp. NPDC127072]|uniref:tryptophan dimethylallyltransferase family protein n=1 Tax=Streptomyces sp. NPDC127072 TaxID=3347129 RepID=UPI00364F7F5B